MANKRTIKNCNGSDKVNLLTEGAEVFWYRLLLEIDDFGNFPTDPQLLKSKLYPKKSEKQKPIKKIVSHLDELLKADLIILYVVGNKEYLHVFNFGQTLRWGNKSLYPLPPNFNNSSRQRPAQDEDQVKDEVKIEVEEQIVFPFDTKEFKEAWELWLQYKKKMFRFKYKTPESHQAALIFLGELSEQDEKYAIHLIKYAIQRQWMGFFHDNNYGKQRANNNGQKGTGFNSSQLSELHKRSNNTSG